jgi:hypothetical protein
MLELQTTLLLADGTRRIITLRLGDVRQTHPDTANPWSASVEIDGFREPEVSRLRGRDWAEAIEDAARFAAVRLADKAKAAGGGTFDPPFVPRAI